MWEALAVDLSPDNPDRRAQGTAKLSLYLDGASDEVELTAVAAWWTPDGEIRESGLQLSGDIDDVYGLVDEASRWIWQRWKKPLKGHRGPFD